MDKKYFFPTYVTDSEMNSIYREKSVVEIKRIFYSDVVDSYVYSLEYDNGELEYVYCDLPCYERLFEK